jgi:predicted DNA binding CopG/RHH family protein
MQRRAPSRLPTERSTFTSKPSPECDVKATFRKDRRLNIRLSSKDLEAIQKRALAEGLPYQTLIASLLHNYAAGRLKEV